MALNLTKGQSIRLIKEDKTNLQNFCVGANWGMITKEEIKKPNIFERFFCNSKPLKTKTKEAVDLDLAVLLFNENKKLLEQVYYGKLQAPGIKHSGDDLTGDEDGDDGLDNEVIDIKLNKIQKDVKYIIFTLNSFNGIVFDKIPYANIRLYEGTPDKVNKVFANYKVNNEENFKNKVSLILGMLYKDNNEWKFKALGKPLNSKKINDIINNIQNNFDKLILS